jgi:hypothetical protein
MKAMAILAVTATLVVAVAEAAGVALLVQARVNKRVALAQEDWWEENTAEVLVVIALHNHVTGCLAGDFVNARYLRLNDIRSIVIGSQSYCSYRIP